MRWRVLIFVSACVNVALLAAWLSARKSASSLASPEITGNTSPATRTHVVVRRQFFMWSEVESDDYATYIANLRDIGCPDQTIRDIIIADVNALFARRRNDLPPSPDPVIAERSLKIIEQERRALLTSLLGPNWEPADAKMLAAIKPAGASFGGAVLSNMPPELKSAVQSIMADSQTRLDELYARAEKEGRNPTAAEIASIENQTRADLQKLLNPTQLEEFLLRNSRAASELRSELAYLRYFNTTATEYRALFRVGQQFDQQIALLADKTDANSIRVRKSLEDQRERALKQALGASRYDLFTKLHDPDYQTAFAQARDAGEPGSVGTLYELNRATQEELNSLRANSNMTDTQLAIAAKRIELEQLKATAQTYGQTVPADPNNPQPPAPPENRAHVIRSGDTFGALATTYRVPVAAILDANPGIQLNNLKPGQRIVIPPLETRGQ